MKKNVLKKITAAAMAAACVFSAVACGGGGTTSGSVRVDFLYGGDTAALAMYKSMTEEYNKTQGKTDKVEVKMIPTPESGYDSALSQKLPARTGPDVVSISDEWFKKNTTYLDDMTGKIDQSILDDLYPRQKSRYHYDIQRTTSNEDDPLYGLPVYNDTTVLYYNKTALKAVGVVCISVEEDELDAWNAGGVADHNGKTKEQYEQEYDVTLGTIPAKGFYRSVKPFVPADGEKDGRSWKEKQTGEIMVFNDRIACNWDEIEDVGLLCTKDRNDASQTTYGYYTEWWFNYGWSVGGDCMEDMTGNGDWTYSHADDTPNFIVAEGKKYTGKYTGTVYQAGETLEIRDVISENPGDTISYYTDEETCFYYTVNGAQASVNADVAAKETAGTLNRLPSIKNAFSRFCHLAGVGGLNVCPYPSVFNQTSSVSYFTSSKLAFLIEQIGNFDYVETNSTFDWGIARMPVYKEYNNPTDPADDSVKTAGTAACHSIGHGLGVRAASQVLDEAYKFVKWMVTDGQTYLAQNGYPSSRISDAETMAANFKYGTNGEVVAEALSSSLPGDWWYMPDRAWINHWAIPLNNNVRYGRMTFDEYIYQYITVSNSHLETYKVD